eukprot:COSAG01_NODE_10770_length_2083_cov_171.070060_2_plen_89_part_00
MWGSDKGWGRILRVRVEIMGSQKCRIVGKSQSFLFMIDPIISTRARINMSCTRCAQLGGGHAAGGGRAGGARPDGGHSPGGPVRGAPR